MLQTSCMMLRTKDSWVCRMSSVSKPPDKTDNGLNGAFQTHFCQRPVTMSVAGPAVNAGLIKKFAKLYGFAADAVRQIA